MALIFFGCIETSECETECPEGFKQLEDCTCVSIDESINLRNGENITLDGWNIVVKSITEGSKYENGVCVISNEKVKLELSKGEEKRTVTLTEGDEEKLSAVSSLFIEDINQIFNIKQQGCEVQDKQIKLNVISSELASRGEVVPVTEKFEISSGTEILVESISMTAEYINSFSNTYTYEEGTSKEVGNDITIEVVSITEGTSIGDMAETAITKSENSQASLPSDYTLKIRDINQVVGSPDTDVLIATYGESNQVTLDERTNIQIYKIEIETENCTEDCEIVSEKVTLKVKPEGSRTAKTFILNEGDSEFVSNRIRVQVTEVNSNIECIEDECVVSDKEVTLRITTYNTECTLTNREVDLELLFPDLSTEIFTLGYGDEKVFITGERVKVNAITEDMDSSINGTCNISNEKVKLTLVLPSNECTSSNHKVQLKVIEGTKTHTLKLDSGNNATTGAKNNILVSVDEFDISVDYNEVTDKCIVTDEKVTLTVKVESACIPIKGDVILSYGKSKSNVLVGNSISIGDIGVKLEDVLGDVELSGKSCKVSNKRAEFRILEPMSEDIVLGEKDTENFGDLKLTIENLNFETTESDGKCVIKNKEAELVFGTEGSETTKTVEEGEAFSAGKYTITIQEILGSLSDKSIYSCNITDRQVKLKLIEQSEEITESANKTEENETQKTETEENPEE